MNYEDTLLQHGTIVQGNVSQGFSTSEPGTLHREDPLTRYLDRSRATYCTRDAEGSKRRVIPHVFTSHGGICYGPASEF